MDSPTFDFGMIGLGTMGRNLLLNIADHGFAAIGFDRDPGKTALLESSAKAHVIVKGSANLAEMVSALKRPRKIMMLVPAGAIVDAVIKDLLPLTEAGDIIIDGGNSYFADTGRRINELSGKNIHFIGMGVSGGEEGARLGPSIMPGGDLEAWHSLQPILASIAAKVNNEPCVAYMGKGAAGHYVKMIHNGIEYAIMQLISEAYDILKRGIGLDNDELHEIFKTWNEGELQSFLVEITAGIFLQPDPFSNDRLIDRILDKAGSKGTGKWTSQEGMDLPLPIPTIDMAVAMRDMSVYKSDRVLAAGIYKTAVKPFGGDREKNISAVKDALYTAIIISYAQGLAMLQKASTEREMQIPLKDVVKIWRGGCIIRSGLLEMFTSIFKKQPNLSNILLDRKVASVVKKKQRGLRKTIQQSTASRIPAAALMSALAYLDAFTSERLPINLVQAQRDLFGAHTYQRTDKEGSFHTEWGETTM
jgi:6-phosphogluconate dehydrogenase